ncbi:MAG: hypothetical protein Q7T86_06240 [Hyphomicrobiaceae bacterium]|jgi:hypothetical protein|nr:hypothetical protein [Hyphomicrobiaceae bacterium]
MSKSTRSISGAAKNTFLDGIVRSALGDDHAARARLMEELTAAVSSLRIRVEAERGRKATTRTVTLPAPPPASAGTAAGYGPATDLDADFDPYTPNVIVVLRTRGRDAALAALAAITNERHLRLLAHEQQLGVPEARASLADLRQAIVAAGERRIANRLAAGS